MATCKIFSPSSLKKLRFLSFIVRLNTILILQKANDIFTSLPMSFLGPRTSLRVFWDDKAGNLMGCKNYEYK